MDMEEDTKSLKGQLLGVCSSLEELPSLDPLLGVWQGVRVRMFMHYQLSARAYFTFLKLSGTQSVYSPGQSVFTQSSCQFKSIPSIYMYCYCTYIHMDTI